MKRKRLFFNLPDSIYICLLLACLVAFYSLFLWFTVLHPQENINTRFAFVIETLFFGFWIVAAIIFIVVKSFGYWMLTDHSIISKKLFRKRTEIQFTEIERVEKKKIRSFETSGTYNNDVYIIYSKDKTIIVPLYHSEKKEKKKELKELEQIVTPYLEEA